MSGSVVCPLPKDDTLNTSFAEYLAFSLIFFYIFLQVSRAPALIFFFLGGGHVPPPALWRRRLWPVI